MISFVGDVKRKHPYQRGRALITGLGLGSRKIIEAERLARVAMAGLLAPFHVDPSDFTGEASGSSLLWI